MFDQAKYGFLDTTLSAKVQSAYHAISLDERRAPFQPTLWTNSDGSARANDGQVTQVWFPGVHCDVGGSYAEEALANITLRWMIEQCEGMRDEFDETAVGRSWGRGRSIRLGTVHDEWKLVPWGAAGAPERAGQRGAGEHGGDSGGRWGTRRRR